MWYRLIYSIILIYSSYNYLSSCFFFSFCSWASAIVWACYRYIDDNFYFQYFMYLYLALADSYAIFCFFSFCADWKSRSISSMRRRCSMEIFLASRASSSFTKYIAFCISYNSWRWLVRRDWFRSLSYYIFCCYEEVSFCFYILKGNYVTIDAVNFYLSLNYFFS